MYSAPATLAVVDRPHTASIERRMKRRLDSRCLAISAASAPPPCKTSYCWGVIGGVLILISYSLLAWRLQVKVDVLPWPYPQPARATEEASRQGDHRPENGKHREGHNR